MSTKRLAIVSSFSESCGIASFAKFVRDSINYYHPEVQVDILELNLRLLQTENAKMRKKGDKHIKDICKQLKDYDAVNIQVEPGLYGRKPEDIAKRIGWLTAVHPYTSLTHHTPQLVGAQQKQLSAYSVAKNLMKGKVLRTINEVKAYAKPMDHTQINHFIARHAIENNTKMIFHTDRARKQLQSFYNYKNIEVHPLKLVPENFEYNPNVLNQFKSSLKIADEDVILGMFGFISPYKGHTLALNTLRLLPPNFKLFIFGKQHPGSIKEQELVNSYIKELVETVENDPMLRKRVFFLGELNDNDFISVANDVDVAWLPYIETGQDGSGIAAITLDMNPRVLCSSALVFDELFKLSPYNNVMRFDIGNELELAQKTQMILNMPEPSKPHAMTDKYTVRTQTEMYLEDIFNPHREIPMDINNLLIKPLKRNLETLETLKEDLNPLSLLPFKRKA